MADPISTPSFSTLLQRFFVEHLGRQRAVSPRTIAAYRDTFRLLLRFAEGRIGKAPTALALIDLDARLILGFLDHLEKDRKNSARSRNARLAALRSFLKYAAHYDLTALAVIEQALAIPMKRFDRPVLGFLSRQEVQAIIEAPDPRTWAGQRDRAFFSLMYDVQHRRTSVGGHRFACWRGRHRRRHDRAPTRQGAQGPKHAPLAINRVADPGLEASAGGHRRRHVPVPEPRR